ncbi:MAG: class I tRNA ligase family protein [Thermodesulfovibrionales bacterium]|nr:class I tRNA ligase family protein [Thermodesulfovibrionales bacterium]
MLTLYNSLGKKLEPFQPVNKKYVTMFTCGPSVYQKSHIGNFRTFLFEDLLARYLEFSGYKVVRGMNFTDIEDKAIQEAERQQTTVRRITEKNIRVFLNEMDLFRMKPPEFLPRASECIHETAGIIQTLLKKQYAYRYRGNVYFDPLRFCGFGKLYGLDMSEWPAKKQRFHKDTYPGIRWNLGDFILWHGYKEGDRYSWDTQIGKGRPSWNVQDAGIVSKYFDETLSLYCGGIDNLFRHHDYSLAILESVRPYQMARFWLHCHHLYVNGQKMSKSRRNILYSDSLRKHGYSMSEIRFFLIYKHYRERLDYSDRGMKSAVERLRAFKAAVRKFGKIPPRKSSAGNQISRRLTKVFTEHMDNDLQVRHAFDGLHEIIVNTSLSDLNAGEASGAVKTLRKIDEVLQVIF